MLEVIILTRNKFSHQLLPRKDVLSFNAQHVVSWKMTILSSVHCKYNYTVIVKNTNVLFQQKYNNLIITICH
jgi:hypothetical protein